MNYMDVFHALEELKIPMAQVAWDSPPETDYMVTAIGGQENALWADNRMEEQELYCSLDLFVRGREGEDTARQVQRRLNGLGLRWELTAIQWEEDPRVNHWTWTFYCKGLL